MPDHPDHADRCGEAVTIDDSPEVCDNPRPCAVHDQPHPLIGRRVRVVTRQFDTNLRIGILRAIDPDGATITDEITYTDERVSPALKITAAGSDIHIDHPLRGKRVTVTFGVNGARHHRTGVLLDLTDDGDVDVRTDDGTIHYLWPMIDIREAS